MTYKAKARVRPRISKNRKVSRMQALLMRLEQILSTKAQKLGK